MGAKLKGEKGCSNSPSKLHEMDRAAQTWFASEALTWRLCHRQTARVDCLRARQRHKDRQRYGPMDISRQLRVVRNVRTVDEHKSATSRPVLLSGREQFATR